MKHRLKPALALLLLLALALGPAAAAKPKATEAPEEQKKARLIAHRGGARWPENSLEAFEKFPSTGADAVELDVRSTKDGAQVVLHDEGITVKGEEYVVAEQTLTEIRALVPKMCTLDEAIDVIAPSGKDIYLHLKETADGEKCARAVMDRGLQSRAFYFSRTEPQLEQVYAADPEAKLGLSFKNEGKAIGKSVEKKVKKLHLSFLVVHKDSVYTKLVKYWHKREIEVVTWTVNDRMDAKWLGKKGVDAMITDDPGKIKGAL